MDTNRGIIELELFPDRAPETVKNFLAYVNDQFYQGCLFHRTIPDFMIQGGGFFRGMKEKKTRPPVRYEGDHDNGLTNVRGSLAVARAADPHSGTSQFFINVKDNMFLDEKPGKPGYCVFGKVIAGMDVVDAIARVKTHSVGILNDVPVEDVVIRAIRRKPK